MSEEPRTERGPYFSGMHGTPKPETMPKHGVEIVDHLIEGFTMEEIGEELDISRNHVGSVLARMRKYVGARTTYVLVARRVSAKKDREADAEHS